MRLFVLTLEQSQVRATAGETVCAIPPARRPRPPWRIRSESIQCESLKRSWQLLFRQLTRAARVSHKSNMSTVVTRQRQSTAPTVSLAACGCNKLHWT